jgi:hypothetical protein
MPDEINRRRHMNAFIGGNRDIDPNGGFRIFKIGTKVRMPEGEIGEVVKIGRGSRLTIKPEGKTLRSIQSHLPCDLDIVE